MLDIHVDSSKLPSSSSSSPLARGQLALGVLRVDARLRMTTVR
jgi:hypothetical protein